MAKIHIPFNKPCFEGKELSYIAQAVQCEQISGNGKFSLKCQKLLEEELNIHKALLTTSCTHALEMVALLLNIQPGDEVVVPSFTFVATINAFVLRGARPVFIDIRPDTLNFDESQLKDHITSRTKAIIAVHYAGVGCEMNAILDVAGQYDIPVIEDNAHGLFGKYKDKYLGSFGRLATQSFHETKNLTCGEGGALIINDQKFSERAEIIRDKGTNRGRFFRGEVDKYTWVDLGSSYLPSDILAAFLYAQLEARDQIQLKRYNIWRYYYESFRGWVEEHGIQLPKVPEYCEQSYHMFYIILPSLSQRQALIEHLKDRSIQSVFHYLPLHLSKMGMQYGGRIGDCPVTEDLSERLLRLPFYNDLSEANQEHIVTAIKEFYE